MKMAKHYLLTAVGVSLLLFSACKKDGFPGGPCDTQLAPYNIQTFRFYIPYGGWDTLNFTYDRWGNPLTGTRREPATGAPNYIWHYDAQHRLTEYIGLYRPEAAAAEFWHKYFYDARGRIIVDSSYGLIDLYGGQFKVYGSQYATYLTYDDHDRVIKETGLYGMPGNTATYAYDAIGNRSGSTVYDNKISFLRTSKVWMFLARDYSVNNPFTATSYNTIGLPLQFGAITETPMTNGYFLYNPYEAVSITYVPR
jgi:hypothetical protein